MRRMETLQDLIEEAKVRTVFWAICVFAITYFLSHTSKSMWTNIPISILILSVFRFLSHEVEIHWRVHPVRKQTYLSHLEKQQLPLDDFHLSTVPPTSKWRRKIDSPIVEAAIEEFINKILQDFVVDLWYSSLTPDKEVPELIHNIILDVLVEISERVKQINLVDLLARYINELIEYIFLTNQDNRNGEVDSDRSTNEAILVHDHKVSGGNTPTAQPELRTTASNQPGDLIMAESGGEKSLACSEHVPPKTLQENTGHHIPRRAAEWAVILDAATKRSEVLAPENLENLWTKGRNYKKKMANLMKAGNSLGFVNTAPGNMHGTAHAENMRKGLLTNMNESIINIDDKYMVHLMQGSIYNSQSSVATKNEPHVSQELIAVQSKERDHFGDGSDENARKTVKSVKGQLKRSSSTPVIEATVMGKTGETTGFKENYILNFSKHKEDQCSALVSKKDRSFYVPKIRCRIPKF